MKQIYPGLRKKLLLALFALGIFFANNTKAQCPACTALTFTVNLTSKVDTAWKLVSQTRSGNCCGDNNCIKFIVYLNPGSDLLNFNVTNPAPSGSAFYSINCGTLTSINTPACINGQTTICITYCKPGGDSPTYHITATKTVKGSKDITVRVGCAGTMSITGLSAPTTTWTSIFPGTAGQYNSYLSCTTGCTLTTVTPTSTAPPFIDYLVSGTPNTSCPGISKDTIRVYVVPGLTVAITPTNAAICSGGTGSVVLTASASGGAPPYTYTWSTGANSSTVNVPAGNYTVNVKDTTAGCAAVTATINVASITTPSAPTLGSNSPICAGQTLSLTASNSGGTSWNWTGPNSFTSTLQNPVIVNATTLASGVYSVSSTLSSCTGPKSTISVTVNPIPAAPILGSNSAICAGQTLSLTATFTAGATYNWTGPNSFTSNVQNPTITNASTLATGTYSVFATINGCSGPMSTISVTVNPAPAAPTAGSNSPLCAGQTLSLTASFISGANYNWVGPNSFTSNVQNPTITNASTLATGTYSVFATVAGCPGPAGVVVVTVNPIPAAPVAGSNSALCAGQTLSLTASNISGATYNWIGPNSFTSNVQNPTILNPTTTASGNYSVYATVNGCTGPPGIISVTINPTPAAPIPGSNSPICAGQTLSLTSTGGTSWNWAGPNSFSSTLQNPTITNASTLATGNYTVTTTANGCTSPPAIIGVTVNPIPSAPILGSNSPICAGSTLSLTATFTAGATYNWTGPNSFTSNIQNPTITNASTLATGVYSVSATVNGCSGPFATISVTINTIPPAPIASSNSALCAGQTLSLTASNIAGATYSWTGPNTFTSNIQNPTILNPTTTASGSYSVYATVNGCTGPAGVVNVTINPTPAAPTAGSNSPLCVGQTLSLTASGGTNWNWSGPNGFTSTFQNPTITNASTLATGNYSVTTTLNGCTSPAGVISVTVSPPPPAPIVGSNSPICAGQTLSLTASFISGASYSWMGPNSFTSNVQNPVILNATTLASGVYTVVATIGVCTGPLGTISVTVNPIPPAPTAGSNSPLCVGQSLNLTASFISGATYSWTGPNSYTANVQNPTITNASTVAAGVYSVNATVNGCPGPFGTVTVTVIPLPSAPILGSNSPICAGSTLSLTATFTAGATYNWTGPNSFTSNVQNPVITNASTLATGVYSVSATVNGCSGPFSTISVTVNAIPPAPIASSNSALCAGQTLSLSASNIAGATYSWTGPNTFTSNIQNPTILNPTITASGTYSVYATVNGCTGPAGVVSVTINPTPAAPVAGSNSALCIGQTLSLTATGGTAWNWSGPNGFTSTLQNPTITNASTLATGVYSVTATANGCTGPAGTVTVLVSSPGTITATSQTVCANNSTVTLSGTSSTGSGTWTSSGTGTFNPNSINGNYIPSGADITAGVITLTLTSTNNGGCPSVKTQITVNITPAPVVNAGPNQSKCANNATTALSGNITVASGGVWSSSGTGTFSPNNTNLNTNYIPSAADITAGSVTITLTSTGNGNCIAVTNTMVIIFTPAPVVNAGPATQFVCKNNPNYQLNSTSSTGSASWTTSGTGTFSPNNNILNPLYLSSTADTTAGTITLTLTSTNNGGCNPVSTVITLVYISTLSVNAGTNQVICSNGTVGLNGISTTGTGTWSSSGTGTFNPNNLNGTYFPSGADITAGTVTLTLTSTNNGGCNPVKSTMIVTITPGPTANAGTGQTKCANNATFTLNGSVTNSSGGIWSSSGTGTFAPNNTTLTTNYIPSNADKTAGTVTITLSTTGNGSCTAATSIVILTITPAPVVAAGGTVFACKNNPVAALNGTSSTGTGTWTSLGSGTFSPSNSVLNPTYTPSTADTTAGVVTLILTSTNNGNCNSVSDTVKIIYSAPPVINVSLSQTVCANNANVVLTGTSSTGSGTWTSSGTGTFSPNSLNGTYIPSGADISAGVVTLTLTSTNNGGCLSVSKQMTLNITPAPTATAGAGQTVCENNATVSLNGGVSVATGGVWSSSGTGTFIPSNTVLTASYVPSAADVSAGTVTITLTTTGNGNCNPVTSTLVLTITPAPQVNAGTDLFLCKNNANAILNGTSSTGSGTWTTSGSGSFNPNGVLSTTYIPSSADTSAGSVTLILISTGNGGCNPVSDTVKVTFQSQPKANFGFANNCINAAVSFTDLSTAPNGTIVSWAWNFGVSTATVQNPTTTFTSTGTHTVSLVVSTGCKDSIVRSIYVNPAPSTSFNYTALCNYSVNFAGNGTVTPGSITGWTWDFGDTTNSIIQNPFHVYKDSGLYIVSLTVVSDSGCVASVSDTVLVGVCSDTIVISNPDVPSGFTPNNDGKNDILFVKGGPFTTMEFRIFNEWGNQIFRSTIQSSGWDGTYKNAPQTSGRYIWTLTGEVIDGRQVKMAGETILSR